MEWINQPLKGKQVNPLFLVRLLLKCG